MLTLGIVAGIVAFIAIINHRRVSFRKKNMRDPLAPKLYWGLGIFTGAGLFFAFAMMFHLHL